MNKSDLIDAIAKKCEMTKTSSQEVLEVVLETINKALVKGETVQLIGFGSFSIGKRSARVGRNPKTGETIKIPASKTVKFSVSKSLKEEINKKK